MKKALLVIVAVLLLVFGCSPKIVPIQEQVVYTYKDSVNFVDSTVYHHLYKEVYKDYAGLLDTLTMETTYARSKAFIDTTNKVLKGEMANKNVDIPVQIKWKTKTVQRDTTIYKEVPVPVEVVKKKIPNSYWLLLSWFIVSLVLIGVKIYLKFVLKR